MLKKQNLVLVVLTWLCCAQSLLAQCSKAGWQADLTSTFFPTFHNVAGIVTIVDEDTLQVEHFYYDGGGIVVYFYLGTENTNAAFTMGQAIGVDLFGSSFNDASMVIDLPPGITLDDYNAISVWCVTAGANFGSGEFVCPDSTAEYQVTFEGNWNAVDHPTNFPAGDHFSSIIGGTHNCGVSFWTPYTLASGGIESMAEVGGTATLTSEVNTAIADGTAYSVISGGGLNPASNNSTFTTFQASSCFPLVTLTSMIAPSPDWFVGVHDLPLYENGRWRKKVLVELLPWDAGTEDGSGFSTNNLATEPPEIIRRIATSPFEQTTSEIVPLGLFIFERIDVCSYQLESDDNEDCVVNVSDFAVKSQNWLLDCSQAPPLSAECFDALNQ